MEEQIYNLLNYIKNTACVPKCDELGIPQDRLVAIVKKCNKDLLLDKEYVYVNVLGEVQYDDNADMGITFLGLKYLEEHNPVGKVIN